MWTILHSILHNSAMALFGPFYVGIRLTAKGLGALLEGERAGAIARR